MRAARLTGRCANGAERDKGKVAHAVAESQTWGKALCGAKPGKRSNGFSPYNEPAITCPRCMDQILKGKVLDVKGN